MMTISEFSRNAVCRYLRSVVLIDDNLFNARERHFRQDDLDLDGPPFLILNNDDVAPDLATMTFGANENERRADDNWVDTRSVTDGFAKEGIVCGVYEPKEFPETNFESDDNFKTLLNVCTNADVFILDWHLFRGNQNENAVANLLKYILREDNRNTSPKPVRFCAIYTAERVDAICDKVYTECKQIESSARQDVDARKVYAGGLTVCIYAKEEATSPGAVAAKDLAERIITDYAKAYEGILPAMALRGIASIRNNAKRILDKFPREMDSALLVHAGLTLEDPSVVEDVLVLLTDEVKSVLHDMAGFGNDVYALLIETLKKTDEAVFASLAENADLVKPGVAAIQIKQYIVKSFESGGFVSDSPFTEQAYDCVSHKADKKLLSELQNVVVSAVGDVGRYKPGALSKLFCLRTVYSDKRVLKPGTIIRDTRTGAYHICLMPLCDSLRLGDEKIFFPFWKLSKADDHEIGKAHGVVVDDEAGNIACLCLKGKIRNRMTLWRFKAENVVAFTKEGSKYVISESPKGQPTQGGTAQPPSKFEWVAELKPFHAQRMAEYVSREFSRVGLTESEWLRQQVDR